jgi:hypothetical protein
VRKVVADDAAGPDDERGAFHECRSPLGIETGGGRRACARRSQQIDDSGTEVKAPFASRNDDRRLPDQLAAALAVDGEGRHAVVDAAVMMASARSCPAAGAPITP